MRLGSHTSMFIKEDSMLAKVYENRAYINERHRHRYEVNGMLVDLWNEEHGFYVVAMDEARKRFEMFEVEGKRFYCGCQFHPEFQTAPDKPHPLFVHLLKAIDKDNE